MKQDMAKILADYSRRRDFDHEVGKGDKRRYQRLDLEDLPSFEPSCPRIGRGYRGVDRRILKRFLESRVGKAWDDVWSEVCRANSLKSYSQWELRDYLSRLVEQNVTLAGGKPYCSDGLRIWNDFWVNPDDGRLMKTVVSPRRRYGKSSWRRTTYLHLETGDSMTRYVLVDGIWYLVQLAPLPTVYDVLQSYFDVVLRINLIEALKRPALMSQISSEWGKGFYAVSRKQLGKRELKKIRKLL